MEKKKDGIQESADKNQKKKLERQEEKLKSSNRELSMVIVDGKTVGVERGSSNCVPNRSR